MTFSDDDVRNIAIMSLGRISVEMFQTDTDGAADWLKLRDGSTIGYGELADMFGKAIDEEIAAYGGLLKRYDDMDGPGRLQAEEGVNASGYPILDDPQEP